MRATFFFTSFMLVAFLATAQSTISGFVKDTKGNPVRGASLTLKDSYDGATTDSTGKFIFKTSEKGEQTLIVSAIGYKQVEQKINLTGGLVEISFSIKEEINEMKAVVITAGTFEASDRKRAGVVLNSLDVVTTASANADITQALKTLPGAQQVGESEGLFVRGGTAEETKIFIDGTLVNRFFYSSGPNIAGYGRFSPFLFKGTVFSAGGYSALYGQALSSAVILESIDLPDQTSAALGISALGVDAGYQKLSKKKNASWGISANYTNLGLAFAVIKQKQDYFQVPEIFSTEGNFRIQTSKTGMLKYYGVLSTNKTGYVTPSLDSLGYFDKFSLKNVYTYHNLSWKERMGTHWRFNGGISYTNNKDDIESGTRNANEQDVTLGGLEFKNFKIKPTGNYLNAKAIFERRLAGLSAIRFGGEYNVSKDNAVFTDYNNNQYKSALTEHVAALFAETDIYLTNALAAKIGGRLEHSENLDKFNIAPRISLAYKLGEGSQASFAYGIFYQNPDAKYLPSPNVLDFAKATHYILQYQKVTALRVFRTEVFYKKYEDLFKTGVAGNRGTVAINNNGFGDAKGFELFWRDKKSIKNFDYWVSYSYLDTKRDFLNYPYAVMPSFAAKHTANLVLKKFVMPWKTGFNVAYNYASSRPYYNIGYDGANYKFTDKGEVPDYNNVSFSVNYIPAIGKQNAKSFAVYVLSVNNIFNIKQTYGYQYSFDGSRKEAIVPPSRIFVFVGAFFSFGIDRTQDAINNNL
jgi:vitamin B12 transporter